MDVVIVGAVAALLTTILSILVVLPAVFAAITVKLNVPAADGVPEITPLPFKFKLFGRLPLAIDHVIGAVPVAARV